MLTPAAAQALTTAATSSVQPGRTTARARPCWRLRQSFSQALRSVAGSSWVSTWAAPTSSASVVVRVRRAVAVLAGVAVSGMLMLDFSNSKLLNAG